MNSLVLMYLAFPFFAFQASLSLGGFFTFRDIRPVLSLKDIPFDKHRLRPQGFQQLPGVFGVRNNFIVYHMGIFFADKPRMGIPGTALPLSRMAQDVTGVTHVLVAEGGKTTLWAYNDMVILAFACCSSYLLLFELTITNNLLIRIIAANY